MTSTFKAGTGGCTGLCGRGGWDSSGFGGGCSCRGISDGLAGDFPIIFVSYLNGSPSEALSLTSLISSL